MTKDSNNKNFDIKGKYIVVNCWNYYFNQVATMVLEHYDTEKYQNTVFILGTYIFKPLSKLKKKYKGKKIIIYQMEQLMFSKDNSWCDTNQVINNLKSTQGDNDVKIWDMDYVNKVFLKDHGVEVDEIVPLKFTNALEDLDSSVEPEVDLFFYGNLNPTRGARLANLAYTFYHENISIMWISNLNFEAQKRYMEKSKIILNLHHCHDYNRQEQPRIFYALINRKCVISQPSTRNYFGEAIIETEDFATSVIDLVKDDKYKTQGHAGYSIFKEMSKKPWTFSK